MLVYGAAVLGIGWWANRRQKTSEDYFLGGRQLRWWAVGISLLATSFSAVSLVGGAGFGYQVGMVWLQLQLGDLVAIAAVCLIFLPFFASLPITTAYEYLEQRFGVTTRWIASALFMVQTLLRTAVLIYAPAAALKIVFDVPVEVAIVITAALAIAYSAFGGIAAVVWTDCMQLAVVVVGVLAILFVASSDVEGGLGAILAHAGDAGRLEWITPKPTRGGLFHLVGALVPYAVFATSLFGTGQQSVQRFLSCRDLTSARRAAVTNWVAGTAVLGLCLFTGVAIRAWSDLGAGVIDVSDGPNSVLPAFVMSRLPAGLKGLVVVGILAAAMSSIDSAIHSLSTTAIVDFRRRLFGRTDPAGELRMARVGTVVFGVLAVVGALVTPHDTSILETLVTWLGYVAGPLLGVFLLGMLTERANEGGALSGLLAAAAVVIVLRLVGGPKPFGFHALWLAPVSCAVTIAVGMLASPFGAPTRAEQLDGLTWSRRRG